MVELTRISTLSSYNTAISNFQKVQGNLATLQDQISSGKKGRDFESYTGQVEQLTGLEKEVKRLKMYQDHNAETTSRLQTTEQALDSVIDITDKIQDLMTLRNNPVSANSISFPQQLNGLRLSVAKELNVSIEGRYLFGGTRTDAPPVIDNPVPEAFTPGTSDDAYYQGAKENVITRVQDNVDLEFDARADDPAFQKLFSAISLALKGENEKDNALIRQATNLTTEALKEIIALRSNVQSQRTEVDRITLRQKDTQLYFAGVVQEIAEVDKVDAASRVAIDQATLQATFQVYARISGLRLSDFLR
jgi:flagellar hook-associated protein 3 FlgL